MTTKPIVGVFAATFSLAAFGQAIPANQEPCKVLGFASSYNIIQVRCESVPYYNGPLKVDAEKPAIDSMLSARIVSDLRALVVEIQGLRNDMRTYQATLSQAKANYEAAAKAASDSQKEWQSKALNDTLANVEKIPARLALDKGLRAALLSSLKEELPKDQDFIDTLRQHTTP